MSRTEIPAQDEVAFSLPLMSKPITLQVGEQRFVTTIETMTESRFFATIFSGLWDARQAGGSYFIDADPELFQHIMRYLRRGILPIFYDKVNGHNHLLYLSILEEAKYFQIPRLQKWLEEKVYLQAVKIKCSVDEEIGLAYEIENTHEDSEYFPVWETRKVYVCPREIPVHRGNPGACGRQCMNARGDAGNLFEDEQVLKLAIIRKEIIVDQDLLTKVMAKRSIGIGVDLVMAPEIAQYSEIFWYCRKVPFESGASFRSSE